MGDSKRNPDSTVRIIDGQVESLASLVPMSYDEIHLGYTGDLLTTVDYFEDGALVATLTLTYSGTKLTKVKRT